MANDRLYMRCRQCGEMVYLSKHFLGPWRIDPERLEIINDFFDTHCWCDKKSDDHHFFNSFELVTENGEGFPEQNDPVLYNYYDLDVYKHNPFRDNEVRKAALEFSKEVSKEIEKVCAKEDS